MGKLEKDARHLTSITNEELFDDLMKQDIKHMPNSGWNMKGVAAIHDQDETRAVVVTFERDQQI